MCKINFWFLLLFLSHSISILSVPGTGSSTDAPEKEKKVIVRKVKRQPLFEDQLTPEINKSLKKWKKYGMKQQTPALTLQAAKKGFK